MAVTIDIPGVGNVEAKNAASEATLQAILKAMTGVQRNTAGGGGGGGGGGSGGGAAGGMSAAGNAANQFGRSLGTAAKTIVNFSNGVVGVIDRLANMGDSLSGAAAVFDKIPIMGTVFAAVAKAVENTTAAYQGAAQSGATFGGSINAFAGAASNAGMTMKDFASLVSKNGEALRFLGGNTEAGGKRFADITKTLRATSKDLYNLGYSTEDVNQGLANYTKLAMQGGKNTNMTNAQLVQGTKSYLKEMDLLAKVTGETRKQQEDAQQKLMSDAQYQAAMAGMDDKVAESFRNTVTGLPGPLRDVAKDIMATGSATTEESQRFMSMMPKSAAMMADFAQKTQRGEQISLEERNKLNNLLAEEGKAANSQFKDIGRYSADFAKQTNMFTAAAGIGKNALVDGAKAQNDATKTTDGQAAAMESMKQSLAEISNTFQMVLANASGVLNSMMSMMNMLIEVVQKYVIPIFQEYLVPAVMFAAAVITDLIIPAFVYLVDNLLAAAKTVIEYLTPAFTWLGKMIQENVLPVFLSIRNFLVDNWLPVLAGVATVIGATLIPTFLSMIPVLLTNMAQYIATGLAVAASFLPITAAIVVVVALFKALRDNGWTFGSIMEMLGDKMAWLRDKFIAFGLDYVDIWLSIAEKIAKFFGGGDGITAAREQIKAEKEELEAKQKDRDARAEERDRVRAANIKAIEDDKKAKEVERANDRKQLANGDIKGAFNVPEFKMPSGSKFGGGGSGGGGGGGTSNSAGAASPTSSAASAVDFTNMSPEQVAAYAYKNQNGSPATGGNEASRREMENKAKAEAEIKEKAAEEIKKKNESQKPGKPPESAETLLASLNTKMDQLIVINRGVHSLNDKQLTVQQGLGSDVFSSPV
jgi:hypothetical protein